MAHETPSGLQPRTTAWPVPLPAFGWEWGTLSQIPPSMLYFKQLATVSLPWLGPAPPLMGLCLGHSCLSTRTIWFLVSGFILADEKANSPRFPTTVNLVPFTFTTVTQGLLFSAPNFRRASVIWILAKEYSSELYSILLLAQFSVTITWVTI